ncbi:hypothetical protein M405DRAFT_938120 [Rhizopogon salebrosus TDB-379]|nr:hypothetical protein M405DRAFT_938120 [Rhizopogon salebrosus TDB-379]
MAGITPNHLPIAAIFVDFSNWRKNVHSAEVRIGNSKGPIEHRVEQTLSQIFTSPMKLCRQDSFRLQLLYKSQTHNKNKPYDVHFDMEDIFYTYGALGSDMPGEEYHTSHEGINIALVLSEEPLRFRILVIGKTGVGKSSLIEHAFGVKHNLVSNFKPGEAEIDTEFISPKNNRFVLHDSKGFEPGEEDNVNIVQHFIERRGKIPNFGERLHAVWICIEIPRAGGRVLETGAETFLKLMLDGMLGSSTLTSSSLATQVSTYPLVKVPVIIVFTKYDELINQFDYDLGPSAQGLSDDAIKELIERRAETRLQARCILPLEEFVGSDIPLVAVSIKGDHEDSLMRLIQITEAHVYKHIAAGASVTASTAQRVDHGLKVMASIDVGKRKYWTELASGTGAFKDRTAWDCLYMLHTEIVDVCNFNDPYRYLYSNDFRILVVNMVNKLDVGPTATTNPSNTMQAGPCVTTAGFISPIDLSKAGLSMVEATADTPKAPAGPTAPIVAPIVVAIILAKWAYDVYQASNVLLQRFMSYIVDLTIILQTLDLVSGKEKELSIRAIKLAVAAYHGSPVGGDVHARVQEYVGKSTIQDRADRDILDKVIELVNMYSIDAKEVSGLRQKIPAVGLTDESW